MKRVLILNGSFCEIPLIEECHRMGYYVITTGNMPQLIGHQYADEYIKEDYSDYEAVLDLVKKNKIDAILSCANDFGSITAAYVDEQMGWGHHDTFANSLLMHHKDQFKEYMQKKCFPTPISVAFERKDDAIAYVEKLQMYPIIVKANDLTGGKGILKAENKQEALFALENAFTRSRSKHVLIEQFVRGNQQTFVTFLHNQKVVAYDSCDSYSWVNPYLIQAETLPAKDIDDVKDLLCLIIEGMAKDLHLADGILAFQYIKTGKNIQIFEMMRRPFGNQFLKLVELNTDFPWHLAQIIAETGEDWNLIQRKTVDKPFVGHYGVMANQNGMLKSWFLPQDIRSHIFNQFVMKEVGDTIVDYLNERVAFLHFEYEDMDSMHRALQEFNTKINIELR